SGLSRRETERSTPVSFYDPERGFELDSHPAHLLKNLPAASQRPPVIKVGLHGSPHRDPAANDERFAQQQRQWRADHHVDQRAIVAAVARSAHHWRLGRDVATHANLPL